MTALTVAGPRLSVVERTLRRILQALLLLPVVRHYCRPLAVHGAPRIKEPSILVANHASHADTAAVLAALPRAARRHVAPAAAEDYFFTTRLKALAVRLLVGAFPFPRHGPEGIRRAGVLLSAGRSVLLFPEGTRSTDGTIARFKCGVGHLAAAGHPVIPVSVRGAADVLPKGRSVPTRAPVAVAFGAPMHFSFGTDPETIAARIEAEVRALHANLPVPEASPTLHARAAAVARSAVTLAVAFLWGIAEALWWPIVPDFMVAPLALAAPARGLPIAAAAVAGSVAGGGVAYAIGMPLLEHAPLVTERMVGEAGSLLRDGGAAALWHQPLSGIPYKVFALQAAPHTSLLPFLGFTALARGARIAGVALAFGAGGVLFRRWLPRVYGALLMLYAAGFVGGLARVIGAWE